MKFEWCQVPLYRSAEIMPFSLNERSGSTDGEILRFAQDDSQDTVKS